MPFSRFSLAAGNQQIISITGGSPPVIYFAIKVSLDQLGPMLDAASAGGNRHH
jgi:hypothetical protein